MYIIYTLQMKKKLSNMMKTLDFQKKFKLDEDP